MEGWKTQGKLLLVKSYVFLQPGSWTKPLHPHQKLCYCPNHTLAQVHMNKQFVGRQGENDA